MTIKTRDSDRLARAASSHAAGAVQGFLPGHCDSAGIGAVVRASSQLRRCGTCRPGPGGLKCSAYCCWRQLDMLDQSCAAFNRQFPEVYDFCHTFLHVAQVKKHTDMRGSAAAAPPAPAAPRNPPNPPTQPNPQSPPPQPPPPLPSTRDPMRTRAILCLLGSRGSESAPLKSVVRVCARASAVYRREGFGGGESATARSALNKGWAGTRAAAE